jgi:hypothetical protein
MYLKQLMTHHRSQDDASHHVRQYARTATLLLDTPFVSRANHASTDAASNAKGTI